MQYALDMSPAEAVANGAQLLDERVPGWWREISLDTLKLSNCRNCVCGQLASSAIIKEAVKAATPRWLFTEYELTIHALNLTWFSDGAYHDDDVEFDHTYGFNTKHWSWYADEMNYEEFGELATQTFWALEREWRKVIEARLEADALGVPVTTEAPEPAEREVVLA